MKALITGISGFAGSHLAEFLLNEQVEVFGLIRRRSPLHHLNSIQDSINLVEGDLQDSTSLRTILREAKPDWIFHLAAQSFVPTSWRAPADTINTNITGQVNLFEAVRDLSLSPTIQIACSSEEYGLVHPNETPIKEDNPLRPLSPYAVSKVAQDFLGYQYYQSYGMKIIRTRAFNHTGPRRGEEFVASAFARQIVNIERGAPAVIKVGNLDAERDFTDVRDVVSAYKVAVEKGKPGEVYNICTGTAISISTLLEKLIDLSSIKPEVIKDPDLDRPSDVPLLLGDCSKFKNQTSWEPKISLDQTLEDLLNWWRNQ
ncbi:GDP-mannose 4,6-dehydratase [bacterium]|nr:GDP-mannose 4,6-dehydratase [bacterium]MBD62426.1 GDP-mannose 4,6-dehydratase [bacterium]|tara:strand:- start:685 stop:1629 length:945 start_codon:yes stop_codon:yes gene_type:complete